MAGIKKFSSGMIETPQEALKREMEEEFGVNIEVGENVGENVHHYPTFSIRLIAFESTHLIGEFGLTDHDQIDWVTQEELKQVDLAAADVPLCSKLLA